MNSAKVSIIMPSLNVADYIEECLLSALNQTLQEIEIICIDAKSTDGTWELLKKYAENPKFKSKIRLLQSEIRSYGYQVNCGIKEARGKYIAILETDDYVHTEMYYDLYLLAEQNQVDFIKADYDAFFQVPVVGDVYRRVALWGHDKSFYNRVICPNRIGYLYSHDYSIWKGIYRKEFLIENDICCNESKGAAFQDIGFAQQVLACAKRAFYTDKSFYRYRMDRELSSVNSPNGLKFSYQEFNRLLNTPVLKNKLVYLDGLYEHMAHSFVGEYMKTLRITDYDMESEYIKPYYEWFHDMFMTAMEEDTFSFDRIKNLDIKNKLSLLLHNQREFVEGIKEQEKQLDDREKEFLQLVSNKKVYIFGAGIKGQWTIERLLINGIIPVYACDNSTKQQGTKILCVEVLSPEKCLEYYKKDTCDKVFVIANKFHYDEMEKQLVSNEISKEEIIRSL